MDPVTLAGIAGGLVLQAIKTFGPKAGEAAATEAGKRIGTAGAGVLRRVIDRVRARFTERNDTEGTTALNQLADYPESSGWKEDLQKAIARHLEDPEFAKDIAGLVDEAKGAGLIAGGDVIQQTATGAGSVQVGKVTGGTVNIGQPPQPT